MILQSSSDGSHCLYLYMTQKGNQIWRWVRSLVQTSITLRTTSNVCLFQTPARCKQTNNSRSMWRTLVGVRSSSSALARAHMCSHKIYYRPLRLSSTLTTSTNTPPPLGDVPVSPFPRAFSSSSSSSKRAKGVLFIDSILPIRLAAWDVRPYLAAFRNKQILDSLNRLFDSFSVRGFKLLEVEPPR